MTTAQKYITGLLLAVALVVAGSAFLRSGAPDLGTISNNVTHVEQGVWWFTNTHFFGASQQTKVDANGNLTNTSSSAFHTLLGTLLTNEVVQSAAGFSLTLSTANGNTQRLTAAQFCSAATVY